MLIPPKLRNTLAFQFLTSFIVFSIIILALLIAHTIFSFQKSKAEAEQVPIQIAQRTSSAVSQYFVSSGENIQLAAKNFSSDFTPQQVVYDILELNPSIVTLAVFDRGGVMRSHLETGDQDGPIVSNETSITGKPYFRTALGGKEYLSTPFISEFQVPLVDWYMPISQGGEVLGVLRARLDLSDLWAAVGAPAQGTIYIVNKEGELLIWQNLRVMQQQPGLGSLLSVSAFGQDQQGVFDYSGLNGGRVLGTWERIMGTNWAVIAEVSYEEIFAEAYVSLLLLLTLIAVVIIGVLYIVLFFDRSVLVPIAALRRGIVAFGQGNFSSRISVGSRNEFGLLIKAFNTMADRIADEPKRLQKEVENRTEELQRLNTQLNKLLQETHENSKTLIEKDHELVGVNATLTRLNEEMDEVGKILVRRDRELTEANERLHELDTVKSEFVSVAAHQLRTPLTGIRWTLQGLVNGEFGELKLNQLRAAKNGLTATETAVDLINDLLDTARIEGGRFGFIFKIAPLRPVIERVAHHLQSRAEKKGIEIEVAPIAEDVLISMDEERFILAIDNAVDNAIKYSTPPGKVLIKVDADDAQVRITVSDTGIGIPKEQQHRLFTKFFRAGNAVLMQTSGTGLGLYMMKSIIDRHEGMIRVESEEGKGTSIIFTLPRAHQGDVVPPPDGEV